MEHLGQKYQQLLLLDKEKNNGFVIEKQTLDTLLTELPAVEVWENALFLLFSATIFLMRFE